VSKYLLNPGMADATLLLVLVRPVEMLDVGVLFELLLREELLLAQIAGEPETHKSIHSPHCRREETLLKFLNEPGIAKYCSESLSGADPDRAS